MGNSIASAESLRRATGLLMKQPRQANKERWLKNRG